MDISERGLALIKDYEGYSGEAYLCVEGVPTLGWGSIRWDAKTPVKLGDKCTREQAENLLLKEVRRIEDCIDNAVKVPLTQGQFDCLCSWGYNVGVGWINGKRKGGAATLIRYLNSGQYEKVPSELLKFKRGANSGKSINSLLNRRKRELKELWFHDDEPVATAEKQMPQAVIPDAPGTVGVITSSGTAKAAGVGIIATIVQIWNGIFGTVKDAGPEIVNNQQALGPFEALFKLLGTNMALLAGLVVLISLAVVIMRKLAQEKG